MSVTGNPNPNNWEWQFLNTSDWYICDLSKIDHSARENMVMIIKAESWMHENCEPDSAYRFGGKFYFKNQDDYIQFSLTWS